jgi:hypothetical protein
LTFCVITSGIFDTQFFFSFSPLHPFLLLNQSPILPFIIILSFTSSTHMYGYPSLSASYVLCCYWGPTIPKFKNISSTVRLSIIRPVLTLPAFRRRAFKSKTTHILHPYTSEYVNVMIFSPVHCIASN